MPEFEHIENRPTDETMRERAVDWLLKDLRIRAKSAEEKYGLSKRDNDPHLMRHWLNERVRCRLMIWWITEARKHEGLWNMKVEPQ